MKDIMACNLSESNTATNMNIAGNTERYDSNDLDESDIEEQLTDDETNVQQSTQLADGQVYQAGGSVHDMPLYISEQPIVKEPLEETQDRVHVRRQNDEENTYSDAEEASFHAMREIYRRLPSRIETFQQSPLKYMDKLLAGAGFWYTGNGDVCACVACEGAICNWKPDDDPWIKHCQLYPNCPFLKQEKGEDFIKLITQNSPGQERAKDASFPEDDLQFEAFTETIVRNNSEILTSDMGFPMEDVRRAVRQLVEQGHQDIHLGNIVEQLERSLTITDEQQTTEKSSDG